MLGKILMVLDNPYPPDIRVEKELDKLTKAGYEVVLLCYRNNNDRLHDFNGKVTVLRFHRKYDHRILFNLTQNFRRMTSISLVWLKELKKVFRSYKFDYVHVHNLANVKTVLKSLPSEFNGPFIIDLHENFPALQSSRYKGEKSRKVFNNWYKYEKKYLSRGDAIIVVAEENKDYLISEHSIAPEKIHVVSNTLDFDEVQFNSYVDFPGYENNFVVSYIGGFGGEHRGIQVLVEAAEYLSKEIPELKILLVGAREGSYTMKIRNMIEKSNLEDKFELVKTVDFRTALSYIKISNVCCVPHIGSLWAHTTIPHKLFQYMYFRKPVLASDCAPIKRIIDETGCGKCYESENARDCARKIIEFYNEDRDEYGKKGYEAVLNRYNWKYDSSILLSMYKEFK